MKKREFWARFRRNRLAISGLALVAGMFAVALLAPWLAPYDPNFIE
ncbi:MAG: peptide ABC transporter permease, partial [Deltaproteobacteria bacterium]|nr:peptide ABC transporter permease [Deltaproteobacteria bacterium]